MKVVAPQQTLDTRGARCDLVSLQEVSKLVGTIVSPMAQSDRLFAHYSIPAFDEGKGPTVERGADILSSKVAFPVGCVLFSKLNPRIPRAWHVDDSVAHPRICSTEFLPLEPRSGVLSPRYLRYLLYAPVFQSQLRGRTAAATKSRERLDPSEVMALRIPLPPLAEQERIAARLTNELEIVERARAAAAQRLAAAEVLSAALLREVFEGPQASGWEIVRLGSLLRRHNEIIHPGERTSGEAVFVGLEHIEPHTGRRIGSSTVEFANMTGRKPTFRSGQIVYGYLRPYLNKVWIADFDGCSSVDQFAFDVNPELADTTFVASFMRSDTFLRRAQSVTTTGQLPRISIDEIAAVGIELPPTLDEQRRLAADLTHRLAAAEGMVARCREELAEIQSIPAALLRAAFNGVS